MPEVHYCYDPINGSKGDHGYPYRFQIMAFDLNEWAAVASGSKKPYDIKPYAVWPLVLPDVPFTTGISDEYGGGAAYDPSSRRIYWQQPRTDGDLPIIQVWEVTNAVSVKLPNSQKFRIDKPIVQFSPTSLSIKLQMMSDLKQSVRIKIVNGIGEQIIDTSVKGSELKNGITWKSLSIPSGTYFIIIQSQDMLYTDQIVLMK
jgi:hypothetical protein